MARVLRISFVVTLVVLAGVQGVFAQARKDRIVVQTAGRTEGVSGKVLSEAWDTVQVDRDGDGAADVAYKTSQVRRIEYAEQPRYMVEAILLKRDPAKLIEKLRRAYVDDSTPKFILQHAYYEIAQALVEMSKADPTKLEDAIKAYQKLFTDIPNTRYAVDGRVELGTLLLEKGRTAEALKQYEALAGGKFGPDAALEGKLQVARLEMAQKRYARAEELLSELAGSVAAAEGDTAWEIKLLRSRALIGQKKFAPAWRDIDGALKATVTPRTLGMTYSVLGDYLAAKGDYRQALLAYLKAPVMYPDTSGAEKSHATMKAAEMLENLGRTEEAKSLRKQMSE